MNRSKRVERRVTWTKAMAVPLAAAALACCTSVAPARAQSGSSAVFALSSAGSEVQGRRFLGPIRNMGNGKVRSYAMLGINGVPREVGIVFTQRALTGLPQDSNETEYILPLPRLPRLPFSTLPLVYDHMTVNWNPHGHDPAEIYGVPHFDFHFYMISEAERDLISPSDPNADLPPASGYVPPTYFDTHGVVPRMGVHWIDFLSPELHGAPFNSTFIYGFYQGDLVFQEPMVSLSYLQTKPNITLPIPQPAAYATTGYYPTSYSVSYDRRNNEYSISLSGFNFQQGVTLDPDEQD